MTFPPCSRGSTKVPKPMCVMGPGRLAATSLQQRGTTSSLAAGFLMEVVPCWKIVFTEAEDGIDIKQLL